MEQNQPMLVKKVWSMVRVAYFMLRKGISKRKLLLDLNMMVKRGKVAGSKALQNLKSHHHHHHHHHKGAVSHDSDDQHDDESEFSCTNSPTTNNHAFSLFPMFHNKKHVYSNDKHEEDLDMRAVNAAVLKAMEMIQSETSSPNSLPGFGKSSPMVRQLRVTDSPFPSSSVDEVDSYVVDEAAEKFINRFYNDLRRQNSNANSSFGSS